MCTPLSCPGISRYFCTHPTQCAQAACGAGAAGAGIYGCTVGIASGNLPLAATSAVGAACASASAFTGMGGMACVSGRIQLAKDAEHLEAAAGALKESSANQTQEIARLTGQLNDVSSSLARSQKERDDIESTRAAQIKQIADLTQELDNRQKELARIQQDYKSALAQQAEDRRSQEEASAKLKAENSQLSLSVAGLTTQVEILKNTKTSASEENDRLQTLLSQFQQQQDELQKKIDSLLAEKASLQHLVAVYEEQSKFQETKIRENTQQYEALQERLEKLQARLPPPPVVMT